MQEDFHYYCIGVLARSAGFTADEALTIAYASQYVDDSTESEPVRDEDRIFEPVRSAHLGALAYNWSIQKRVYMPFHFIPPKPMLSQGGSFVTEPNSEFAQTILQDACDETGDALLRLCRIGVALHTYADTWAHQGFSGRHNEENDVERIRLSGNGKQKNPWFENIYLDILPQIGHVEAGHYPDQPFLNWEYKGPDGRKVSRNNPADFLTAAKTIHARLSACCGKTKADTSKTWGQIEPKVRELLSIREQNPDIRCERWNQEFQKLFGTLSLEYDKLTWRREALQPKKDAHIEWDDIKPSKLESMEFKFKPGFYKSKWVNFHRAALHQRHLVLEQLM